MAETRGQEARRRRKALGLTQAQLAGEAKVSESTLRSLEGDKGGGSMTKSRDVFDALERLEGRGAERRGPGLIAAAVGDDVEMDVRTRQLGRIREVSAFVKPLDMSDDEFWALIREMHKSRQDPRD